MKKIKLIPIVLFVLAAFFSCDKEENEPIGGNTITLGTTTVETILSTKATVSSAVISIRGNKVIMCGHCWSTSSNPDIDGNKTSLGSLTEDKTITSQLDNLTPNIIYYIRPYIATNYETIYGEEKTIRTLDYTKPTIATISVYGATAYLATSGGVVTSDGGCPVTARGVVWSTSIPTISNNLGITVDGSGTGSFNSQLSNLQPGTTYNVRAYATNIKGTAYGTQLSFNTSPPPILASLTTSIPSDITSNSAVLGGNIMNDGNTSITERGICYSTSQNPTTSNVKVALGNGTGNFTNTIAGLLPNTQYYIRAYATNSQGTAYGNEVSFKTLEQNTMVDIDGNIYHTITIGTQVWMAENLRTTKYKDGTPIPYVIDNTSWSNLSTGAYCWYNNDINYKQPYGALYNWYAVNSGNLAPAGWHVATDAEWTTLITYLGGLDVAGGKLKETGTTHWYSPNTDASNSVGFSSLPGGYRSNVDGLFHNIGYGGYWWSTTKNGTEGAVYWKNLWNNSIGDKLTAYNEVGFSVRCIKNY